MKDCARRRVTCPPARSSSAGSGVSRRRRSSVISTCSCPNFDDWTKQTLDDWREWADRFNAAGAVARKAGIWLGFHNEAYHQKPIDGQIPLDVFINRLDPSVTRLQLDVGNMLIGGGDPMLYLQKYPRPLLELPSQGRGRRPLPRYPYRDGDFDFKKFLAAVLVRLEQSPAYVESARVTQSGRPDRWRTAPRRYAGFCSDAILAPAARNFLKSKNPRPDTGIVGAVGDRVLEMEAPEAVGILLQIQHRIAAADQHVADVELQPGDGGIEPVDEDIQRDLAVDRLLVVSLVVEPEPDPRFPRDRRRRR